MVTQVLQQQHAAVRERFAFRFSLATDAVGGELNRCAKQLRQPRGNRPQAVFRVGLALGASQVRAQNEPRTFGDGQARSEERRVGKEYRDRWARGTEKE